MRSAPPAGVWSRIILTAFAVAALFAFARPAHADDRPRLRLDLSRLETPRSHVLISITPTAESTQLDRTVLMLAMRAHEITDPRPGVPQVMPIFSTTTFGGTLRLDF